jgi:hypothetical protein
VGRHRPVAAVVAYALVEVDNFRRTAARVTYLLLLDVAPILHAHRAADDPRHRHAAEIDLTVASVVGYSSVLLGVCYHEAGSMSLPVAAAFASLARGCV